MKTRIVVAAVTAFLCACGVPGPLDEEVGLLGEEEDELGQLDSALSATNDMHRLLEDIELEGDQGVTESQVQAFLASKQSFLANYVDPRFGVPASRLIVEKARAFRVSPVYLLARIQTESSLIENRSSAKLDKATGCGCPDTGGCSASYAGFGRQVECAAAKIRNYLTALDRNGVTVSGWRVNAAKNTSDPCGVRPANRATAVLYTYTPWVGAYATQCGQKSVGGSSLLAGKVRLYRSQHNWNPALPGAIGAKYLQLGGASSFLGQPLIAEQATPTMVGAYVHFQGGSIYWSPSTGAWSVRGAIRAKWEALSWERGILGFPMTDELTTPDGAGRFNHFVGGSLYWSPRTGAFEIHGQVRDQWAVLGWEKSALGYPVSDVVAVPGGFKSSFEHGEISLDAATGATTVVVR